MILKSFYFLVTYLICILFESDLSLCESEINDTVLAVILVRNKDHLLPYFFHYFENINYPKHKLALFIRTDHNSDKIGSQLKSWLKENGHKYLSVNTLQNNANVDEDEDNNFFGGDERRKTLLEYKEDGLINAREIKADFVWFLDLEALHTNSNVLQRLIQNNKTVISPMLTSITSYSNFWSDMTEKYSYKFSDDYMKIVTHEIKGCFPVALVRDSVLINLNHEESKHLSFTNDSIKSTINPHLVDNVVLSFIAKENGIDKYICNDENYGHVLLPSTWPVIVENELSQLSKLNVTNQVVNEMQHEEHLLYDKLYCINLKRRPERRENMRRNLKKLGLKGTFFDAIDWKDFNETYLKELDIRVLKNYDKGDVTFGVIANFLSHYFIWEDIVENHYEKAIILEDDVYFHDDFLENMQELTIDLENLQLDWELVFLGRRPMTDEENNMVPGSHILVKPKFSWWLIGYMLSYEGAKKLLDQKPLQKMIPADEYVPIMFDEHPKEKYKKHFHPRDINAFAIRPTILSPTHYHKEEGYISDTAEAPDVIDTYDNTFVQIKQDMQAVKVEL